MSATSLHPAASAGARDLTPLFDPRSVAVVGASNDQSKYGNWLSSLALRDRQVRPVYLINRRGEPVLGQATYPRLVDVQAPVDLVAIAVPAAAFESAVDDALAAGARAIVGITSGFAELGEEGAARQAAIVDRVRAAGAVLLGPNCLGVVDTTSHLQLASNEMPRGPVGLISQSGNMALELSFFLQERGLGFSRFASLGNQSDITAADLLASYGQHDGTDLIALYCEDFLDGRAFTRAAAAAVEAGKRVVLLTVGSSQASRRGARSHTGALTSEASAIRAACEAGGIDAVSSPREMADVLAMLHGGRTARGRRLGILADGGGHAALASDLAEAEGLEVTEFPASLSDALRDELPPSAGTTNPIDVAGAGEQDITSFGRVLDLVLAAPEVDAVLVTGYFGGYGEYGPALVEPELATAQKMGELAAGHGKPVAVQTMYPAGRVAEELRAARVPVFRSVDDAVRGLARVSGPAPAPRVPGLPRAAAPVADAGYWTARELLRAGGLDLPEARLVGSEEEAAAAAGELGGPLVLKALGLLHKSDAGGVVLGLRGADELRAALRDMQARLAPPGFCVERMADLRDGVELIVGVQCDPRFGPVAMVGLGGVYTEVLRDVAFALAPVDEDGARRLLARLRGAPLLAGVRGRPAVDLGAVAAAVARITSIACAHPEISELEVNPLLARPQGCLGLDARIVLNPHRP